MSKLIPLFSRVLCKREKAAKIGSIIVPKTAEKRLSACLVEVIAVGETADKSIKVGKTYIVGQHAGAWINEFGIPMPDPTTAEYYICQDEDVLCEVWENEPGEVVAFPH